MTCTDARPRLFSWPPPPQQRGTQKNKQNKDMSPAFRQDISGGTRTSAKRFRLVSRSKSDPASPATTNRSGGSGSDAHKQREFERERERERERETDQVLTKVTNLENLAVRPWRRPGLVIRASRRLEPTSEKWITNLLLRTIVQTERGAQERPARMKAEILRQRQPINVEQS